MPLERQNPHQEATLRALENLRIQLLDLTARNGLMSFRHTESGSLRIIDGLPDQLAETLLAETEMRILPVPEPTREKLIAVGYLDIYKMTEQQIRLLKDPNVEESA